jgi:hypothetical protein
VRHCIDCGAPLGSEAKFCGSCGTPVAAIPDRAIVGEGSEPNSEARWHNTGSGRPWIKRHKVLFAVLLAIALVSVASAGAAFAAFRGHGGHDSIQKREIDKAHTVTPPATPYCIRLWNRYEQSERKMLVGSHSITGARPLALGGPGGSFVFYLGGTAQDRSDFGRMCGYYIPISYANWRFIPAAGFVISSNDLVASPESGGFAVEQPDGTYTVADETGLVHEGATPFGVASLAPRSQFLRVMTYEQLHQAMNATNSQSSPAQTSTSPTQATPPTPHPTTPPATSSKTSTTPSASAQQLTTFTGSIFSIGYPSNWPIDTNELKKPGYYDTTIRSPSDPEHTYLRIDYSLNVKASLYDAANQQRQSQPPGYRELGFDNTTLSGHPAIRWEFEGYQKGSDGRSVFVHKIDIFMIDSSHAGWAILTQAPSTKYYSWLPTFNSVFQSFATTH